MIYNELEQRGTIDFPVSFYHLDKNHIRYHMTSHWHSEVELIRILKGELNVKLDKNEYIAQKGDIFFINPETVHGAMPDVNCVYECIVMHIDFLIPDIYNCKAFIENIINRDYIVNEYNPRIKSEFNKAVNDVFDTLKYQSAGQKFKAIGALYKMFGVIIDEQMYTQATGIKTMSFDKNILKLKRVLSYIRANYDKPLTLSTMADTAEMSLKYFCSFFKEMTGKTPFEYLNEYRIEKATQRLITSDQSVTEIAYSCGFNDLSYFIKTFKRIKDVPPGSFRKK